MISAIVTAASAIARRNRQLATQAGRIAPPTRSPARPARRGRLKLRRKR